MIIRPVRPVSVEVLPGCHAYLLERHVSETALFVRNKEEREESMVKLRGRCFPRGEIR